MCPPAGIVPICEGVTQGVDAIAAGKCNLGNVIGGLFSHTRCLYREESINKAPG